MPRYICAGGYERLVLCNILFRRHVIPGIGDRDGYILVVSALLRIVLVRFHIEFFV